ncbi:MAG: efflux RND transporter permease subunit [Nitrospirae bacterium]|nr:MAG: efflux RND transporter permease subunit [Nitrospirota bacterium]
MVKASLKNPYAVVAISLIVVILGVVSYQKMVVDIFPEINVPVVAVATFYKGMGPSEIEGAITLRLEQLFLQASYVEHIESRSLPGVSLIKIYFHPNYNVDAGLSEITSLTYSALRFMPKGMFPPTIIKFGATNLPIANLTLSSNSLSEKEVRDIAYYSVRPQLGTVQGISLPPTFGGAVRQVTVFLDREKMQARGIGANDIIKAVNAENLLVPAGNVKIGDFDYNVYSNSIVSFVKEMNDFPVKVTNGVPVYLKDVGTAADSTAVQVNVVRVNGYRSVYVPILKQAGANTLAVIDGIREALPKLKGIPADLKIKLLFDQSLYIRQSIGTVQKELLLGGGLACLMILIFLGSIRSMLIIAVAIPISIATAFVLLYFTGHTVNIMTLGGLALAVGTLVDNSIIVLENIHRHMEMGKSAKDAALDGAGEMALPMLVITACILIVYLPIVFFTGTIRFLFVPLALAVAYAMGASYVASLTVAPIAIAACHRDGSHDADETPRHRALFNRFADGYADFLRWGLDHKAFATVAVGGVFVMSMGAAPMLATEFFPKVDAGEFILNVAAPEGTRLEKTEAIIGRVEEVIHKNIPKEELDQVVSNIGLPQGWMVLYTPVVGPHQAFVLVSLQKGHRTRTDAYIDRIRGELSREFPSLKFSFQTGGVVSDVINAGLPAPVDIKIGGEKLADLSEAATKVRDAVAAVPGTVDVRVRQGMDYPEVHLNVNRVRAALMGLTEQQILADVVTGLSSNISGDPGYWIDPKTNNAYFVVAQYPEQSLKRFEDFLLTPLIGGRTTELPIRIAGTGGLGGSTMTLQNTPFSGMPTTPAGGNFMGGAHREPVFLKDVIEVQRKTGPETIDHHDLQRSMDVMFAVAGNDLGAVARRVEEKLAGLALPKDVSFALKGEVQSMRATMQGFAVTLPLAVLLVYLVMVGLFRSYLDPLVILASVPLGFIGVVWMLLLTSTSLNLESLIGSLMMIGIVVSNSILIVDFANALMQNGIPVREAVVMAGRLRLRPIVMTALATILGLLPMALGFGEGAEANIPLARAVIGGMAVSCLMTLLFVPILHSVTARRQVEHT